MPQRRRASGSAEDTETFRILYEVAKAATGVLEPHELSHLLVTRLAELIGRHHVLRVSLYWWMADRQRLVSLADSQPGWEAPELNYGEGVYGACFASGEALALTDYLSSDLALDWAVRQGVRSAAGFPLKVADDTVGVLGIRVLHEPFVFDESILRTITLMCGLVSPALHAAQLHSRLAAASAELGRKNVALVRADQLKSEFLANMSHELRTPLNSILGFAQLMRRPSAHPLDENQQRWLGNIESSGRHLLALVNDVLDLSKVAAGRMELRIEDCEVASVINDVITKMRSQAALTEIHLTTGQITASRIRADRLRLTQALVNLVSNAIKFTGPSGHVQMSAVTVGEEIEVRVSDDGVGIKAEDQDLIFEEFTQGDNSRTRNHEGTGLGLPLSRRLVELMGGRLTMTSESDHGSQFVIHLPLAQPTKKREDRGSRRHPQPAVNALH